MNVLYYLMGMILAAASPLQASSIQPTITGDLAAWCIWDPEYDRLTIEPENSDFFDLKVQTSEKIEVNINKSKEQEATNKEVVVKNILTYLPVSSEDKCVWFFLKESKLSRMRPKTLLIENNLPKNFPSGFYSLEDLKITSSNTPSSFKAHYWTMEPQSFTSCLGLENSTLTLDFHEPSEKDKKEQTFFGKSLKTKITLKHLNKISAQEKEDKISVHYKENGSFTLNPQPEINKQEDVSLSPPTGFKKKKFIGDHAPAILSSFRAQEHLKGGGSSKLEYEE